MYHFNLWNTRAEYCHMPILLFYERVTPWLNDGWLVPFKQQSRWWTPRGDRQECAVGTGAKLTARFKFTWQSRLCSLQAAFERGLFTLALYFWMHFLSRAAAELRRTGGLCTIIKRFLFSLILSVFFFLLHVTPSFDGTVQAEDGCIFKQHRTNTFFRTRAPLKAGTLKSVLPAW